MDKIVDLEQTECLDLINELKYLDKDLSKKVMFALKNYDLDIQEALDYVVNQNPTLWAKTYLNWEPKDHQFKVLEQGSKRKTLVLRLGRRLGKSECMCILILWYAANQPNIAPNGQYNILIITPYDNQVELIFTRLKQLIYGSELLTSMVDRDIHHLITFTNGTIIKGLTAGSKNNSGADNTRGEHADVIIMDEVDYIGSKQISNIINIRNEHPERIKMITASTPCGKHEEYYEWCTNATYHYRVSEEDIKNYTFSDYEYSENKETGNGWTEVYAPSTVNKELLKVNPDTGITYLEELKSQFTDMRYEQEVMARFGEQETGVYKHEFIQAAIQEGARIGLKYISEMDEEEQRKAILTKHGERYLAVDWDKSSTGTHIVVVEYDRRLRGIQNNLEPKLKVILHEEIPRSQFTYTNATNRVIELNEWLNIDHITVDEGYGLTQIEMLHKYGIENPESGICGKLKGYQFSEKIETRDPFTNKVTNKPFKPFMVNSSVLMFERGLIALNPRDKVLIKQLQEYSIKSFSSTGAPIYTDENEHSLDCLNLNIITFRMNNDKLFRTITQTTIRGLKELESIGGDNIDRRLHLMEERAKLRVMDEKPHYKLVDLTKPRRRNKNIYQRSMF